MNSGPAEKLSRQQVVLGETPYLLPASGAGAEGIRSLVAEEEYRILQLRDCGLTTPEYMLVYFVRMYTLRWALPVVEIERGGTIGVSDIDAVRVRLWLCLYGRAIDDIADRDSAFFGVSDSVVLATVYGSLLRLDGQSRQSLDDLRLVHSACAAPVSAPDPSAVKELSFDKLADDLCRRVAYFVGHCADDRLHRLVRAYVAVLLARCDLEDAIADGCSGSASTMLSRNLRASVANEEGKVLFNSSLWRWYAAVAALVRAQALSLVHTLRSVNAECAAHVVSHAQQSWDKADAAMPVPVDSRQ